MGVFKRKSKKKSDSSDSGTNGSGSPCVSMSATSSSDSIPELTDQDKSTPDVTTSRSNSPSGKKDDKKRRSPSLLNRINSNVSDTKIPPQLQAEPTVDMVPDLVHDLKTAEDTSGEQSARALRMLFALSENSTPDQNNREILVQTADGQLVPVLLEFLRTCERSSSEQYLALLVLNNVSIPVENKKFIAIDCGGAHVLCRLLCEDPSCHLMAIILVNLTFADAELRKELVAQSSSIELVDALSYALQVACMTPEDHDSRPPTVMIDEDGNYYPPRELLAAAMEEDRRQRKASDIDEVFHKEPFDPSRQLYPETARWCLCALKNLTRPSKDAGAAHALIDTGIVPLILRIINVGGMPMGTGKKTTDSCSQSTGTPAPAEPPNESNIILEVSMTPFQQENERVVHQIEGSNPPSLWDSNTIQDAALFTVINLAAFSVGRRYLREEDAVHILSLIADFPAGIAISAAPGRELNDNGRKLQRFQCLKARIALAYLVGSEGHFGQSRPRGTSYNSQPDGSVLLITADEAELLVELLSNTLHQRVKEGPGGYSAAAFTVRGVLHAIRSLLTNNLNQITFATTVGMQLNSLLLKALAQHSIQRLLTIDAEAAEHASFCLYLQSNYGFKDPFLPAYFGRIGRHSVTECGLAGKVISSYLHMDTITPAGHHAADQILLRLSYLVFEGAIEEMPTVGCKVSDFEFEEELVTAAESIIYEKRRPGARPLKVIFSRSILRSRVPKKGNKAPWDNRSAVTIFPSALIAAQQLSFGSLKVRHMDAIDDILIANNIANSANGLKTESYNYWWSWQDSAPLIQENLARASEKPKDSSFSIKALVTKGKSSRNDDSCGPLGIFGFNCGSLCIQDDEMT